MRVLITAGSVYGRLDDNKLVSNRSRGIWALRYAERLYRQGHYPVVLIPDVMSFEHLRVHGPSLENSIRIVSGFDEYRHACHVLAPDVDAAVMASAVVNWIPQNRLWEKCRHLDTSRSINSMLNFI